MHTLISSIFTPLIAESLLHALDGGRLVLVILLAPWCNKGATILHELATSAAQLLDDFSFFQLTSTNKPLIGIMDSSTIDDEFIEIFGNVTYYPAMKFILTFPDETQDDDGVEINGDDDVIDEGSTDHSHLQIWDYIGPKETAKHLFDSVVMYWYRFVVTYLFLGHVISSIDDADEESNATNPPIFTFASQHDMTSFLQSHGNRLLRPSQARKKHTSKLESEVFHFYMGMEEGGEVGGIFHPFEILDEGSAALRTPCHGHDKIDDATPEQCDEISESTQEIDPYTLIVQCRSTIDFQTIDIGSISVEELMQMNKQRKAMKDFEELAVEMAHRPDVAFLALDATAHDESSANFSGEVCGELFGEVGDSLVGAVAFVKIRRFVDYSVDLEQHCQDEKHICNVWDQVHWRVIHRIKTDWDEMNHRSPLAVLFPAESNESIPDQSQQLHGKYSVKNPLTPVEYVGNSLVASTIVHTTPTVIWFDKERMSQLAFPWYRKVHAVLFVDMGLAYKDQGSNNMHRPPWPASLDNSTEAGLLLLNQQRAIRVFYDAALQHRMDRPSADVVFLIVPSSEVRIMTAFGIDIWTPLDEELFGLRHGDEGNVMAEKSGSSPADSGYCSNPDKSKNRSILPVMMITDSSGRNGMQSSRYYLCSDEIAKNTITNKGGAIWNFINSFFDGTIGKPFVRSRKVSTSSQTAQDLQSSNKPNVTVLTGNTFESLVMDRDDEHTMLLLQSNSCGHCKRFSIFWNELSSLVQSMNWSSVISVMKIDVSTNDVPHDRVNAWDLPSVYYFPAHEKDQPIELATPSRPDRDPQQSYDEGLTWVSCGYDIVKWMIDQGKLDLEELMRLDGSTAMPNRRNISHY